MERLLVDKIIHWIISIKITDIPITLNFSYFQPHNYSVNQTKQLIKKGFNPKVMLYLIPAESKEQFATIMTITIGKIYKEAKEDFWFCFDTSKCDPTCSAGCPDKKGKFIYSAGFRVKKNKKIGQGGFGSVHSARMHGAAIAAKFIDVTDDYKNLFTKEVYYSSTILPTIIGDVAYEASIQSGFGHKNILKSKEWWLQLSMGKLIELVISTPKCYSNLKEWLDK